MLLGVVDLLLVMVCVMVALSVGRRPHFWPRVFLGCLGLPSVVLSIVLVTTGHLASELACPIIFAALIAVPFAASHSLEPPSDHRRGDDGGGGPDQPAGPPNSPRGDVPLSDADPSALRVRDHSSPKLPRVSRRREHEHEPAPRPSVPID